MVTRAPSAIAATMSGEVQQDVAGLRAAEVPPHVEQAGQGPVEDDAARDEAYAAARHALTDDQISAVIWMAIAVNALNRVSVMSKQPG